MTKTGRAAFKSDGGCFIIAEIGTSHGGDLCKARELIDAAAESGADCAKFQIVFAKEIIHPKTGVVPLPGGDIPLFETFRQLEKDENFFAELKSYTEKKGLRFLCTPFGMKSARILKNLGVDLIKIASPELNYVQLLEEISGYGVPVLLSSGVSTLSDIEKALAITGTMNNALLHCITAYPAPEEEYNVHVLKTMSDLFGITTGISDHSLDPILVPVLSVLEGGKIIEKHFTLSREGAGLDDPIALPPGEFSRMAAAVRWAEAETREIVIRELENDYPRQRIHAVIGSGVKTLALSERENYGRTNRSIHAVHEIKAGSILNAEDLSIIRTEKILKVGLSPEFLPVVLGKKTVRGIPSGEGLTWNDLLPEG